MNEGCRDCTYVENLEKEIETLRGSVKENSSRINSLERAADVERERTDMIFKILNEIKGSIEKIANKIDDIESRPNKLLWGVLGTLAGALIVSGLKYIN